MRTIKFRAWHKADGMKYYGEVCYHMTMDGSWWAEKFEDQPNELSLNKCGYIFMQYTGLKDKNGVEIYEGDIIFEQNLSNGAEFLGNCEVRYVGNAFCKIWKEKHYGLSNYTDEKYNRREVIGNIYENPELMEAKNDTTT